MKTLILYYSQAVGNTERVANKIQEALGADMEKIDTVVPYTGTYEDIVDQGKDEVDRGIKPAIKPVNSDVRQYDRIVIATPTWWYTMAPAVRTLLSGLDLSGKDVVLVQTHGGWPAHCIKDMAALCDGANIVSDFAVQFDSTGGDKLVTKPADIDKWLDTLKA